MAVFVLIPGAGGVAWYWHRVVALLEKAGHHAIAVDLPGDDETAGFVQYADRVIDAIGKSRVVLVAQSLGAFTAAAVCARVPVKLLVFVNAMIPMPRETAGAWGDNTGSGAARNEAAKRGGYSVEFDDATYFFHDLPARLVNEAEAHERGQTEKIFKHAAPFDAWPDIPVRVVAGRDDRLFPLAFQRRVASERLGVGVDVIKGGHLVALSNPRGLTTLLLRYATQLQ
jgi:pimeloyl-ACP methyl ester carboxylesterase